MNNNLGWRKWFAKRWMFPALYMAVAGIMLTTMWLYQNRTEQSGAQLVDERAAVATSTQASPVSSSDSSPVQARPSNVKPEAMVWPYRMQEQLQVIMPFYDTGAPTAAREKALIKYDNSFVPHVGIDFARADRQPFAVQSAMSGFVSHIEKHPLLGNVLEITHENQLVTVYQSLAHINVTLNQQVKQGEVVGQAGRNELEKDMGVHLHFEVRQNGKAVNPQHWISRQP
jgi:stage II sporulation protein Q